MTGRLDQLLFLRGRFRPKLTQSIYNFAPQLLADFCLISYRTNTTVTVVPCCSPLSSRTCQP